MRSAGLRAMCGRLFRHRSRSGIRPLLAALALLCSLPGHAAADTSPARYVSIPGGRFRTALPVKGDSIRVAPYRLRALPVSNREFAAFVARQPQWQRSKVPAVFADPRYLATWGSNSDFAPLDGDAPVTAVSWFAAAAFCENENARLPTWHEWEFAAAASTRQRDARKDPQWRREILGWYEHPAEQSLPPVGRDRANAWGVHNLHGLIWEWVQDYNGLFVTTDSRGQSASRLLETCGAAALSLGDRENYAVLMRVALLAALDGKDNIESLGFRCARNP